MEGEWLTISTLGTFGGAVFAVTIISQYLKDYVNKATNIPVRMFVLLVAWIVLIGRRYVTMASLEPEGLYLDLLNGVLVALAAMGTHSVVKDNLRWE